MQLNKIISDYDAVLKAEKNFNALKTALSEKLGKENINFSSLERLMKRIKEVNKQSLIDYSWDEDAHPNIIYLHRNNWRSYKEKLQTMELEELFDLALKVEKACYDYNF